jgi:hypothetical protein
LACHCIRRRGRRHAASPRLSGSLTLSRIITTANLAEPADSRRCSIRRQRVMGWRLLAHFGSQHPPSGIPVAQFASSLSTPIDVWISEAFSCFGSAQIAVPENMQFARLSRVHGSKDGMVIFVRHDPRTIRH